MADTEKNPFWRHTALKDMNKAQWESLCDGCGLCCLHKLEDEDTGEIHYTKVACRLLDTKTCRCTNYTRRKQFVPDCMKLNIHHLKHAHSWLPETCAYRRLYLGQNLPKWHPLISGDKNAVHKVGISAKSFAISETNINGDLDNYLL
ncbi:MAG: YcgN family cysteine cluster protein [Francisellaceae bacterium]